MLLSAHWLLGTNKGSMALAPFQKDPQVYFPFITETNALSVSTWTQTIKVYTVPE